MTDQTESPAVRALVTQCDYYASEIDRLMAERDEWKAKFERLGPAGMRGTMTIEAMAAAHLLREALTAYMEPAGEPREDIRKRARSALASAKRVLSDDPADPALLLARAERAEEQNRMLRRRLAIVNQETQRVFESTKHAQAYYTERRDGEAQGSEAYGYWNGKADALVPTLHFLGSVISDTAERQP